MKFYILPENKLGERTVMGNGLTPTNMDGVDIVELNCQDEDDFFAVAGREGKEYPAYKIAKAINSGQIKKEDITLIKE